MIDDSRHGGWPSRHPGRRNAYPFVRKWLEQNDDPYLMFAVLIPAIECDDQDYAALIYKRLVIKRRYLADWIRKRLIQSAGISPTDLKFPPVTGASGEGIR